jgi:hypothetical protein
VNVLGTRRFGVSRQGCRRYPWLLGLKSKPNRFCRKAISDQEAKQEVVALGFGLVGLLLLARVHSQDGRATSKISLWLACDGK